MAPFPMPEPVVTVTRFERYSLRTEDGLAVIDLIQRETALEIAGIGQLSDFGVLQQLLSVIKRTSVLPVFMREGFAEECYPYSLEDWTHKPEYGFYLLC